ncbi:hypothetical protein EIP86_004354 [Pleurotus ostreatoroseus]|nr:hypothetical protein EIP86_004354 [Pleurotus ostreatoroseus]
MSGVAWHYVLKFIITGDAAVGKSSLLVRLTDQRFLANPDPTASAARWSLTLSDNAHAPTGFLNARSWLKDVREHADPHLTCILVGNKVDLCPSSEDDADRAQEAAPRDRETAASSTSKRKREVSTEEAELWAQEEGLLFVEASAKSGLNVEDAFERATRDILDKIRRGVFDDERVSAS